MMEKTKMNHARGQKVRLSTDDKIYYAVAYAFLVILLLIILYPLVYIVSASFSSPLAVSSGKVILWPVDFSLEGYEAVFKHNNFLNSYKNSIVYTTVGTAINVAMTMIAAYPLSRKDMPYKGFFMFLFTFTMMFSGGMIPDYILLKDLSMLDTMWALIIPTSINVFNMIIARTFLMSSIPGALLEAAQIDGCSDANYFFRIVLPLAKPVMAVIMLYYAVGHWNSYFAAFLYINSPDKYPLQIVLRDILIANNIETGMVVDSAMAEAKQSLADLLKYSLIVISSVPVLALFPFVKKFFVKGVMIGSVKG